MPTPPTPPTTMTWRRDGYDVWCDEDGVHLRVQASAFEMPEAMALVELYQQVLAQYRAGQAFAKPTHPPREQLYTYPEEYIARRFKAAVDRAIKDEFARDDIVAF